MNPALQAQAWAILPELAKDLNHPKRQEQRDPQVSKPSLQASKSHPEDMDLQAELIRARIPESKKGKAVQPTHSFHGGRVFKVQSTHNVQLPSTARTTHSARESTRLEHPQSERSTKEDGWEPARVNRRVKGSFREECHS
jgi:hypothetical protein